MVFQKEKNVLERKPTMPMEKVCYIWLSSLNYLANVFINFIYFTFTYFHEHNTLNLDKYECVFKFYT